MLKYRKYKRTIFFIGLLSLIIFIFMNRNSDSLGTTIHSTIYVPSFEKNNDSMLNDRNINVNKEVFAREKNEYVVLVHGIASGSWYMKKMARELSEKGYTVINLDYPSRRRSIDNLTKDLYIEICNQIEIFEKMINPNKKTQATKKRIHFVGHSMGAFIIRCILSEYSFPNLGRVVQLAPPNKGSEISDYFDDFPAFEFFYGSAGIDLSTKNVGRFYEYVDYELGIIAGNKTLAPFSSFFLLEGEDDGRVRVENTKILGMKEHIVLSVSHTLMGFDKEVIENMIYFLENGSFINKQ